MSANIFISYAREDRERVRTIAEELARRGHDVWWDMNLRAGEDYRERIEQALQTARCVVVAWSRHSRESDFVIDEAARGHRRRVLAPVFIDPDIDPPLGFGGIHTNDLSGWLRDPADPEPFDRFARDVAALIGQTPTPSPADRPPPPVHHGRAETARPSPWVWMGVLVPLLVAAFALWLSLSRDDKRREVELTGGDTATIQPGAPVQQPGAGADTPTARTVSAGARVLADLRCTTPGSGRNDIADRAERLSPPEYRVNTTEHLLVRADGQAVRVVAAEHVGQRLQSHRLIVAHHTAGPARPVETFFERGTRQASAHLLIDRGGRVTQLVPFDVVAFHAGQSRWGELENLNRHSIGIEMENLGRLTERDGAWFFGNSLRVPADSVERTRTASGATEGWHRYTDAQLRAFFQVSCALRRAYPTIEDVVGHQDIAPSGRRVDPGPAFPLDALRSRIFPNRAAE